MHSQANKAFSTIPNRRLRDVASAADPDYSLSEIAGLVLTIGIATHKRAGALLVTARVRVEFIAAGRAQRIPKALRLAMEVMNLLAVQRPNESNPRGFCCDIVKPVLGGVLSHLAWQSRTASTR